jgi:hypothetical protein
MPKCYHIIYSLGKSQPNPWKVRQLWEHLPIVTLDRHSPRFSDDKSPQGGNPGDPRGIEMESLRMINGSPIGQILRYE